MTTKIPAELSSTPSIVDNGNSAAITIDSSQQIGFGTTSPAHLLELVRSSTDFGATLEINNTSSANGSVSSVRYVTENENAGLVIGKHSNGFTGGADLAFINQELNSDLAIFTNNTERLRILSGGGMTFNGDTATTNALDDYEEGTWTPAISTGGVTYTIQVGKYTKIGNFVSASFHIDINTNSNGSSTTFYITGLPFTASAAPLSIYYQSATLHCNLWNNSSIPDNGLIAGNTAALNLYIRSGTSVSSPTHGSLGGGNILATMNYQTDA